MLCVRGVDEVVEADIYSTRRGGQEDRMAQRAPAPDGPRLHGHGHRDTGKVTAGGKVTEVTGVKDATNERAKRGHVTDGGGVREREENEEAVVRSGEGEEVFLTHGTQEEEEEEKEEEEAEKERQEEHNKSNSARVRAGEREFGDKMAAYVSALSQARYTEVGEGYPVQELGTLLGHVSRSVTDYRDHASTSQRQLEALTDAMGRIRENLHFSVSRRAMDMRIDARELSQEERDLEARGHRLTAALAKANADVTEAIRLATETESVSLRAGEAAERAREETRRVQEEAKKKEEAERKKKEENLRKMEEERRQKEEEERKEREEKERKEREWQKQAAHSASLSTTGGQEDWEERVYEHVTALGETEVTCVLRGSPGSAPGHEVTCRVADDREAGLTLAEHEEVISHVVQMEAAGGGGAELKTPVHVAIPHLMSRSSGQSREPVVKSLVGDRWVDLPTRDVTLDSRKEQRFAQTQVHTLTRLVVTSRYKRDHVTLAPHTDHRVTSSFDQRINLQVERGTFQQTEHLLLEVQPIDSASLQDFRSRVPEGKALLTTSSILSTTWETPRFDRPVTVHVSCPPNPAKARKLAQARRLKEEKMKNPQRLQAPLLVDQEKEKEREKKRMQQFLDENGEIKKVTKWYMGQYAHNDDDESDKLQLMYQQAGKWLRAPDVTFRQVKVDVVSFLLEQPVDRFLVARTRTNVEEETLVAMVTALTEFLSNKFVEAVVRQRSDDPFMIALQVCPLSRVEASLKALEQRGFESGPAPSHVVCLREGDVLELGFSGNIVSTEDMCPQLIYKTNVPTVRYFRVTEENKFRQKEQGFYSGLLLLSATTDTLTNYTLAGTQARGARTDVTGQTTAGGGPGRRGGGEGEGEERGEGRRKRLCALQINIPKYHPEVSSDPRRAPVTLHVTSDPVDDDLLHTVAQGLGEEWRRVAHYLGLRRPRVQALGRSTEGQVKYLMLQTWLKAAPRALDKVRSLSSALKHSDREDLAQTVQDRGRDFWMARRQSAT